MYRPTKRDGPIVERHLDIDRMIGPAPNCGTDRSLDILRGLRSRDDEIVLDAAHTDQLPDGVLRRVLLKAKSNRAFERYPTAGDSRFDSGR